MPLDMQVLNSLFQAARELSPEARKQYLDEVCGTDATMRKQLEDMLDVHHEHRTPTPQGPTQADPQYQPVNNAHLNLKPGDILENTYQIIEKISQGGMGAVYRAARVTDLKMEVAIKVIKPGLASPHTLARFNNEKQALAIMKHENISRVLDAGTTPNGLPFFVMELVKGVSITQFCDDNKLTVRERLELFVPVCEAIQHAHLKGVVHRDLKPSNILVALYDDKAVPKIIDFGLAKALHQPLTDDIIHTGFKTFVGTYQYAAPEQAQLNNLDIDTRADIYSLGVVLYELLTGAPTLSKERITNLVFDEVLRAIREEEPLRPSTKLGSSDKLPSLAALRRCEPVQLKQQIQGEIDWIVMKALEKERSRRFESANAFAADLRRYLAGEAVESGPASWSYRTGKYLKKHRGKVIAGGLLAAAILVGSVVSTIGWVTANRERARANQAVEVSEAVNEFVITDLIRQADPAEQIKPSTAFIKNITIRQAIDIAENKVEKRFVGKPHIEAAIRHSLGQSYLGLGEHWKALKQLEKAKTLYEMNALVSNAGIFETANDIAWCYLRMTKTTDAEKVIDSALAVADKQKYVTESIIGKLLFTRGVTLEELDRNSEAVDSYRQAYVMQIKAHGEEHHETLNTRRALAVAIQNTGKLNEAESMLNEVLIRQKTVLGEDNPDTFTTINYLGLLYREQKLAEKALTTFETLAAKSNEILGPTHPKTLAYRLNIAESLASLGRLERAGKMLEEIIPMLKSSLGELYEDTIGAMQSQAAILAMTKKPREAYPVLLDALQRAQKAFGIHHRRTIFILENMIALCKQLDDVKNVQLYQQQLRDAQEQANQNAIPR